MSSPRGEPSQFTIDVDVAITMPDGCLLRCDVYRESSNEPRPTILIRHPYDKAAVGELASISIDPLRGMRAGFNLVIQDVRGRYSSDGLFEPYVNEVSDGAATLSWIESQPWASGEVFMSGASYFGATQLQAASSGHEALVALNPIQTSDGFHEDWTYQGGAIRQWFLESWSTFVLAPDAIDRLPSSQKAGAREHLEAAQNNFEANVGCLPLVERGIVNELVPEYERWIVGYQDDAYWDRTSVAFSRPSDRPSFFIGGWFDLFVEGTLRSFRRDIESQVPSRLTIGPWHHGPMTGIFGDSRFPMSANGAHIHLQDTVLSWFQELRRNGTTDPRVDVFLLGQDRWLTLKEWPPEPLATTRFYLDVEPNRMRLVAEPQAESAWVGYRYNPADPTPTIGGRLFVPHVMTASIAGLRDQEPLLHRDDVLTFLSDELTSPLTLMGCAHVQLHVKSDAPDSDFTVALIHVDRKGRYLKILDSITRMRYRRLLDQGSHLGGDSSVNVVGISLGSIAYSLPAGDRLAVCISSSSFPQFDRNTNSGDAIGREADAAIRVANQVLFTGSDFPSYVELEYLPLSALAGIDR